jgi:hypothetical protein
MKLTLSGVIAEPVSAVANDEREQDLEPVAGGDGRFRIQ